MSKFETRRRQAAIRCGHNVTTRSDECFRVVDIFGSSIFLNVGDDPEDIKAYRRQDLMLDADQLTKEDEQKLIENEQARRSEFARTLSPLFQTYTFNRVRVDEGNRAAFNACQRLEHGTNLFIHGAAGNGKTMLAVAATYRFVPYYSVAIWGVVNLFSTIRASFGPHARAERPNLERPELLVLDDIGKTKASDFVYEELYGLINYRLEHGLTTIFTSNHPLSVTALKVSPDPDNLGAMVSRLASGAVVEVKGRDRRVLNGKGIKSQT